MLSKKIIKEGIYRYSAKEIKKMFLYKSEVKELFNQCSICGYMYYIEDGVDSIYIEGYEYKFVCNNCIELLENGVSIDKIPYSDESTMQGGIYRVK